MSLSSREIGGLFLLAAAAGFYWYSTTDEGSDAIAETADDVGDLLNSTPRGIRNNNPGNIVRNGIQWQGLLTQPQVQALGQTWDPKFCQFDTAQNGLRALAKILISYAGRGDNTVSSIISTYAPSSENDTNAYINAVAAQLGVNPGATINVSSYIGGIMESIVQHENGEDPYYANDYSQALASALNS